jgi:hypothetical protein
MERYGRNNVNYEVIEIVKITFFRYFNPFWYWFPSHSCTPTFDRNRFTDLPIDLEVRTTDDEYHAQ